MQTRFAGERGKRGSAARAVAEVSARMRTKTFEADYGDAGYVEAQQPFVGPRLSLFRASAPYVAMHSAESLHCQGQTLRDSIAGVSSRTNCKVQRQGVV